MRARIDNGISLFPPQGVAARVRGSGRNLRVDLQWKPPRVHAGAVAGYRVERTSWWLGVPRTTTRLNEAPVRRCVFVDKDVTPDRIHEYRVFALHSECPDVAGPPSYPAAVYGFGYLRYAEMVKELRELAARHRGVCRLVDAGAATGGRHRVWCMVLGTDTRDHADRPGIMLVGNPHASEVQGTDVCMGIVRESLRRYAEGDATFRSILDHVQTRIIPMYNPYGRTVTETGLPLGGRKTRPGRPLPPALDPLDRRHCWRVDFTPGVDPNRAFDAGCRESPELRDPKSAVYMGRGATGCPEARAVVAMARALRPQISVHYHGPCGYPLYPGGLAPRADAVDTDLHLSVARAFAQLSAPTFCSEDPEESPTPSSIPGTAIQWFYKNFYGAHLCPEGFYEQITVDPHVLCISGMESLEELLPRNLEAFVWMARRTLGPGITVRVRDARGRPVSAEVEVAGRMDPLCDPQRADSRHGVYRRLLPPGVYLIRIRARGRRTATLRNVRVEGSLATELDVTLEPEGTRT